MFNRQFPLGVPAKISAGSPDTQLRILDMHDLRNTKVCIQIEWASEPSDTGMLYLIPGMNMTGNAPALEDYSNIGFATFDPAEEQSNSDAGIRSQSLPKPLLNNDTGKYESRAIVTLISSEVPRYIKVLVSNNTAVDMDKVTTHYETSQ